MIIYKAQNKINEKIYIGQTKFNVQYRILEHLRYDGNTYFNKALKKYGIEVFDISIIDTAETKEELDEKEKYWIKFYNCKAPNGYNLTDGGDGVINPSEESRKKMSEARKGKHPAKESVEKMIKSKTGKPLKYAPGKKLVRDKKISEAIKGRLPWNKGKRDVYSEETLRKMREAKEGKHHSEEHNRKLKGPKSKECKEKIGDALRGKKQSPQIVEKRMKAIKESRERRKNK